MGKSRPPASKSAVVQKSTGPRSDRGKALSSKNATKHAIFSKLAVITGESQTELNDLKNGLVDYFNPVGTFEEVLVDTIAVTLWRQRRLLIAEKAEVEASTRFVDWDERQRQLVEAGTFPSISDDGGLMRKIANTEVRDSCLYWLTSLKASIEDDGFVPENNMKVLMVLYGGSDDGLIWRHDLIHKYPKIQAEPDDGPKQRKLCSPDEYKTDFLNAIDSEIDSLRQYGKEQEDVESQRVKVQALRQAVPDSPQFDRILRPQRSWNAA